MQTATPLKQSTFTLIMSIMHLFITTAQETDKIAPRAIADLTAERLPDNMVKLKWTATGNDGDSGNAYRYDIRYAYTSISSDDAYLIELSLNQRT